MFVWLGLLHPVVMLPDNHQLHGEPAGLLLPAAAGDAGVHHNDSPRHGGASKKGTLDMTGSRLLVHNGLLHEAPFWSFHKALACILVFFQPTCHFLFKENDWKMV